MTTQVLNNSVIQGENDTRTALAHSRSASRASSASTFSSHGDGDGDHDNSRPLAATHTRRNGRLYGTPTKKAKRVRFFRNGDRFFKGVVMPVTPERYRSFDSLLSDVTHTLKDHVNLPNGVRTVFTLEGSKISCVDDLEDGKCYVCSGQGEPFKRIEYLNLSSRKAKPCKSFGGVVQLVGQHRPRPDGTKSAAECIRPRVVTLVRNGTRPRKAVRLLLNKRNAPSLEHALGSITDAVKLDTGAVRKVFTALGVPVLSLDDLFLHQDLFFVYGSERFCADDFQLDAEELKAVQVHKKTVPTSRRTVGEGAVPRMPKKVAVPPREPRETEPVVPSQVRLKYKIGKVIGDGNFAVVRRCTDRLKGGDYAIKIIDKSKCKGKVQFIENEVQILRKVNHSNIIRLLWEHETNSELYLVMELEGGDLFDAIAASCKFPEDESRLMVQNLSSALAYLHARHIVHRDVKPENLLVRLDENNKVKSLKLGDFGLAQRTTEPLYTVCGTPTYVAPEMLSEQGYGLEVDVWAAGVIMYILLCGFPPFASTSDDQEELFDRILTGVFEFTSPYWDDISDQSKDLITNMLQGHPEIRFSAEDVLDHLWIRMGSGDAVETDEMNNRIIHRGLGSRSPSRSPARSPARSARSPAKSYGLRTSQTSSGALNMDLSG